MPTVSNAITSLPQANALASWIIISDPQKHDDLVTRLCDETCLDAARPSTYTITLASCIQGVVDGDSVQKTSPPTELMWTSMESLRSR